ncbi:MAG: hypothetical protein AB1757_28240 [Acidobacteriota bacterium]
MMKAKWEKLIKKNMSTVNGEKHIYRPNKGITVNILLGGGEFSMRSQNLEPASPSGYCSLTETNFDIALDISQEDFLLVHKFVPDISTPNVKHTHHIPWEMIVDIIISERVDHKEVMI